MSATERNRSRVVNAALIVGVLFVISRLLGLVREQVFANYFGVRSLEGIAIPLVITIPDIVFILISGGALGSAFIPVFATYFIDEDNLDEVGAWRLFSAVCNLVLIAAIVVAGLTALFAEPLLARIYASRLAEQPKLLPIMVPMLRVMLLAQVVFGVSGVVMVTLNARQHFTMPAVATVVYNVAIIIGTLLWQPNVMGVAYGMLGGALAHLAVQLPALRRIGARYRPIVTLHYGVRRVLWLMAPRTIGLAFSYLNLPVMIILAQTMTAGSEAALRLCVSPHAHSAGSDWAGVGRGVISDICGVGSTA